TVVRAPAVPGPGGLWVLAAGFALAVNTPDIASLSQTTGADVQYFASHRVIETHIWAKASGGRIERWFGWSGESGEILRWVGRPDSVGRDRGLPGVERGTQATIDAVPRASINAA